MNLKRQKTSIKNRKYTGGKKDTTYFTKKLNEFGLKVPKYLGNGNITQKQFNSLKSLICCFICVSNFLVCSLYICSSRCLLQIFFSSLFCNDLNCFWVILPLPKYLGTLRPNSFSFLVKYVVSFLPPVYFLFLILVFCLFKLISHPSKFYFK